jgi:hypothetical protein
MKVYTLESSYNTADTCRDLDDIHTKKLGVFSSLALAKAEAIKYKLDHFFKKDVEFFKHSNGNIYLMDVCSYPTTLTITEDTLQ